MTQTPGADGAGRPPRSRNFIESLNHAFEGLRHAVRTQPNMRAHAFIALLVFVAGIVVRLSVQEFALLVLTVALVMVAEMVNTAVETAVDLVTTEYHPLARIAKNVAAGAVLLAAIASAVVGVLIFFDRLARLSEDALARAAVVPEVVTLAALGVVLVVVTLAKAGERARFRIQGGFPSAHAALAASLATLVWLLGGGGVATVLSLTLAVLVGQARVEGGIHNLYEVTAGAVIGFLLTVCVFQLLG